ncbi:WecB/TagA/CpsF family glycosyltransferase [Colwellia sp. Bg11-28]|uniref:WecB/TagA/CpsF family glycosyltransferase n=1 Tax=Colwellia sp. Bg11-28 TaxID=2058305 RepID=UPI000C323A2B|nr:WecB/TagA/CpsF family glycosyltransferase [Colwellia sp. Bg11-28]PKH85172.1 glycosyltransferase [Colwellia sp. Bg11-28]
MEIINTSLVNLHNLTMVNAINTIKKYSETPGLDIVVTPNIDHLARIITEGETSQLKAIYDRASLCLCDSRILQKLLKRKNKIINEVITGSTLTQLLFDEKHMLNKKVLVVGGEQHVFDTLSKKYKALELYHINPPMGFINNEAEVTKVLGYAEQVQPNFVFLAVGSPRQEILAEKLQLTLTKGVALCIGASILFLVGEEIRAPLWVQKMNLEWCFRMLQNPKVLVKRYFGNSLKLQRIYKAL